MTNWPFVEMVALFMVKFFPGLPTRSRQEEPLGKG